MLVPEKRRIRISVHLSLLLLLKKSGMRDFAQISCSHITVRHTTACCSVTCFQHFLVSVSRDIWTRSHSF